MIKISSFALLFITILSVSSFASEPAIWTVNSRADVLKGDAQGVSIDQNGAITPAPKFTELFDTSQSYIWATATDPAGTVYLATGGEGRIYKVPANGTGALLTDLNELNVTALAIGGDGSLFAATSPDGKVYKIDAAGRAAVYFDPKEKYIWSLAFMNDGSLAVGTGESGKIYRVRNAGAIPESSLLFDTSETHIITLAVDSAGNLYAGTDSSGLVLRFGSDGKPFALLDSTLREIKDIAIAPNGGVFVLAVGDSAASATAAPAASATPASTTVAVEKTTPAVPMPQKSRYDLTGARSAVYRIMPDGGTDLLWASTSVTGFSLYAHRTGNGVLLGTSDKGRIYDISNDGTERLLLQSDANQISTISNFGDSLYATSSNQGRLFRFGAERVPEGVYESAVLDSRSMAAWGRIWWRSSGSVRVETRSGNTEQPNETWSPWAAAGGGRVQSPNAKYLQWRAALSGTAASSLNELSVAYLPRNIAPEILSVQTLDANIGLLANPPIQIDPNIELSGIDPQAFGIVVVQVPPRRAYLRGARGFQWTAEDRNGDKITYDIYYKEVSDAAYKLLRSNADENFYSLDGLSLPDGRYTLKIVANDSLSNPAALALSSEIITEPFDIDNTQPIVTATGNRSRAVFTASDRSGYLVRAEYSINGGPWQAVFADDGISDSPTEQYTVTVPASGDSDITLRVFDASGNAGTGRFVIRR